MDTQQGLESFRVNYEMEDGSRTHRYIDAVDIDAANKIAETLVKGWTFNHLFRI